MMERIEARGFIVHAQVNPRDGRVFLCGRLEDGRSFALADSRWRQSLVIPAAAAERARAILSRGSGLSPEEEEAAEDFQGEASLRLRFSRSAFDCAAGLLASEGVPCLEADLKAKDARLLDLGTRGGVSISGEARKGRRVDLVFSYPELSAAEVRPRLSWAAIDLETAPDGSLRAASIAGGASIDASIAYIIPPPGGMGRDRLRPGIEMVTDEAALIAAFSARLVALDPDVVTGWNIVEFDFRVLSRRCAALDVPFDLGRSEEASRYLEGRDGASSAVIIPGRQCVDAMRVLRSSGDSYEDMSLETVSIAVLGEGKSVSLRGEDKLAELERLWLEEPEALATYCARDSALVLAILEKTGLGELTAMRASLTGVSLDRAWTSIGPFERLYATGLRARGVALPPAPAYPDYGSPGGLILEPLPGLFRDVIVLDFKSLYPTVIRTFNIDPLAHERATGGPGDIVAPNGARFSRSSGLYPGILPEAIGEYFRKREEARASGDRIGVHVYKILMNSFYGVLGARGCRYARAALAGAVTGFGQKYLSWTRDWMEKRGWRVLYGDTDSVFVQAREARMPDDPEDLAASLNANIAAAVREEYDLESFLEIKVEKIYDRFFIPRLRFAPEDGEARGRAKGYAGRLAASGEIEVKGMEAARSDWTPLAREFQPALLAALFGDATEAELRALVDAEATAVMKGLRDDKLVFRRRLRRPPEAYTKNEPPHVKAARALGWKGRRGTVEYVVTVAGPEALSLRKSPIDYGYYVEKQLLPMVRSVAESAGLDIVPREAGSGQLELGL